VIPLTWPLTLLYGFGALVVLEVLYVFLRRQARRFRMRLVYHLWALASAALVAMLGTSYPASGAVAWRVCLAATALFTVSVLFSVIEALVLLRPWVPQGQPMLPELARDATRLGLLATTALVVAYAIFGYAPDKLLLSSTALLAVLGLALQDLLKNVFAGMSLQTDRAFASGDWLMIDGVPAQVQDMSWRSTRLRTNEGVEILEPNSLLSAARLTNLGAGRHPVGFSYRIGLPYDAPPATVKQVLHEAVTSAHGIAAMPAPEIFLESYGDSAIVYRMRVWTQEIGGLVRFQDAVLGRVWYALQRAGISVPFPIRSVHLTDSDRGAVASAESMRARIASVLGRLPLFRELDDPILRQLAASVRGAKYDAREVLVHEGDHGDSLFVIETGSVRVTKSGEGLGTGAIELARLGPGQFFGEMSLLTGEPRSATVTADAGCEVLVLAREALQPLLEADPSLAGTLSRSIAERSAETEAKLENRREQARTAPSAHADSILARIRSFFKLPEAERR
jgi:small-conductance mechanosensitive channel/CRP-like cAMP-binding protein